VAPYTTEEEVDRLLAVVAGLPAPVSS